MTLKTQMTSDLSVFFNTEEHAETVTYTPKGGAAVSIDVIVNREADFQEDYVRGRETATCTIMVKVTDVTDPQHGDVYTFNSEDWDMDSTRGVIYEDSYILIIGLERRD